MKENTPFSSKCLCSFSTRPAVNLVGVKRFPPTSPSANIPNTFIVMTTVEVQGGHHSRRCLDLVRGCHGLSRQEISAESVHLVGEWFSSTSGLGLLSSAGSGQFLWSPTYGKHWSQALSQTHLPAVVLQWSRYCFCRSLENESCFYNLRLLQLFLGFSSCDLRAKS